MGKDLCAALFDESVTAVHCEVGQRRLTVSAAGGKVHGSANLQVFFLNQVVSILQRSKVFCRWDHIPFFPFFKVLQVIQVGYVGFAYRPFLRCMDNGVRPVLL